MYNFDNFFDMNCVSSFLSLCGCKIPHHKCKPLMPNYCTVLSASTSASCSNDFITSTSNSISICILTTCNTVTSAFFQKVILHLPVQ